MISFTWSVGLSSLTPLDSGRDLMLNALGTDLFFADGKVAMVDGVEAIASDMKSRLQTFAREYFLNLSIGVPYLEASEKYPVVLGSKFNSVRLTQMFREEIVATPGVPLDGMIKIAVTFVNRVLSVAFAVRTEAGDIITATMRAATGGN